MAALRLRVDGCGERRFRALAPAEAGGFREHTQVDECSLDQFVLVDFTRSRQRDDPCGEPATIFNGIGFIPLDRKKALPDRIECARQSRFGVVDIGMHVGGCHLR